MDGYNNNYRIQPFRVCSDEAKVNFTRERKINTASGCNISPRCLLSVCLTRLPTGKLALEEAVWRRVTQASKMLGDLLVSLFVIGLSW